MTVSLDVEKAFTKIQYSFILKGLGEIRGKRNICKCNDYYAFPQMTMKFTIALQLVMKKRQFNFHYLFHKY